MSDVEDASNADFYANTTAEIVAAYVGHNSISATDLPKVIAEVHAALLALNMREPETAAILRPAVSIKQSVTDDFLICLDDGKKFKSLKRHLAGLGMTPHEYRAKWGLPAAYPMVAPGYSAVRSQLAKTNGLGSVGRGRGRSKH